MKDMWSKGDSATMKGLSVNSNSSIFFTRKRGILREDIFGCWSQHNEDVDDATFRDPAHIGLWSLTGALNVIQHFSKHRLGTEQVHKKSVMLYTQSSHLNHHVVKIKSR